MTRFSSLATLTEKSKIARGRPWNPNSSVPRNGVLHCPLEKKMAKKRSDGRSFLRNAILQSGIVYQSYVFHMAKANERCCPDVCFQGMEDGQMQISPFFFFFVLGQWWTSHMTCFSRVPFFLCFLVPPLWMCSPSTTEQRMAMTMKVETLKIVLIYFGWLFIVHKERRGAAFFFGFWTLFLIFFDLLLQTCVAFFQTPPRSHSTTRSSSSSSSATTASFLGCSAATVTHCNCFNGCCCSSASMAVEVEVDVEERLFSFAV